MPHHTPADGNIGRAGELTRCIRSGELFHALLERLSDSGRQSHAVVQLQVTDPERCWTLDLNLDHLRLERCTAGDDAVASLRISEADLVALAEGEMRPVDLYQRGRLRVDGDMHLARKVATALYKLA